MLQWNSIDQGLFPFNTKFRKFRMLHQMERTNFGLVRPEYSGPALEMVHFDWSGHFGQSDRNENMLKDTCQ